MVPAEIKDFLQPSACAICRLIHVRSREIERMSRVLFKCIDFAAIAFRCNAMLGVEWPRDVRIFGICCETPSYLHLILVGIKLIATHVGAYMQILLSQLSKIT